MTTVIRREPVTGQLSAFCVGRPVGATHIQRITGDLGFLVDYNVQSICAQEFATSSTSSRTYKVSYTRNPGVDVLWIEAEPIEGTGPGASGTVTLTSSAGSIAWLSATPVLDGTADAFVPGDTNISRPAYGGYLDVTGLTVGTTYDLNFAFVNTTGTNGIAKLTVLECPTGTIDPARVATDMGVDESPILSGLPIVTNTTTSPSGMARILAQQDKARKSNKRQWQVLTAELDADAFSTTSGSYAKMVGGTNPTWRFRARRLYATSSNNTYTLGVRYKVTGGGTAALRMLVNGSATNLTGLTSATYTEATTGLNIPCNGATDQEVTLQFEGKTSAGTFYVSRVRLLEAEL